MQRRSAEKGLTLVELMVVVALLGILAGASLPRFIAVADRAHEGTSKGNLGILRSALAIYFTDNDGRYPTDDLTSLVTGRYLRKVPAAWTRTHQNAAGVNVNGDLADSGAWIYGSDPTNLGPLTAGACTPVCVGMPAVCSMSCTFWLFPAWGNLSLNCTHNDLAGVTWNLY